MKIGIQLPHFEREVGWDELAAMAATIEELGFDSIWVGDHYLFEHDGVRRGTWEAWSQLAALAAITKRVQLGPLVAALPFHNPAVLAKIASTVDEIASGRLVLGVGAGWNELEFKAFDLPYQRRVSRFGEEFEIIRRLLEGQRFDFEGEFYSLEGAELLPGSGRGRPPLMIGSNSPRMLSIALPHVDMWNSWYQAFDNDPAELPALLRHIDQACRQAGRDPASVQRTVALLLKFDREPSLRADGNPITGTPSEMARALRSIRDLGISHVQLVVDPITLESIERAAEVIGRLESG